MKQLDKNRIPAIKFAEDENGQIGAEEKDTGEVGKQLKAATGTTEKALSFSLLHQAISTAPQNELVSKLNYISSLMHEFEPRDAMEGVLITQMAGTHNTAMNLLAWANNQKQPTRLSMEYIDRARRLMSLFTRQMEALQKYRGRASPRLSIENVNVNEGGQAIVGNIDSSGKSDEENS